MKRLLCAALSILGAAGHAFAGGYESSTRLNSLEWDETSNALYAWMDNTAAGEFDKLYMYDWTASGNSIEKAKAIYATLLAAYTSGFPLKIWYTVEAKPTTSGWGVKGVIGAVRLGDAQAP